MKIIHFAGPTFFANPPLLMQHVIYGTNLKQDNVYKN